MSSLPPNSPSRSMAIGLISIVMMIPALNSSPALNSCVSKQETISLDKAQKLPEIFLHAGPHNILAETAVTEPQRRIGLMHRSTMPDSSGMVFAYENHDKHCFWMKNTRIPLDAAFIADDGVIINIAAMMPMSEKEHCAAKPVRFILEMNQGWFAQRGITPGAKIDGLWQLGARVP